MEKLTGLKKVKTAVFISGTGSNFNNLIKFSKTKKSPISIGLVISSSFNAKGLRYAKISNIKKKVLNFEQKKIIDNKILHILNREKIEFICLAGFMKILSKNFIKTFNGKIINIHPSLLPKYKGLNTHERVLKNKDKFSGCTVHFVTPKLDSGKIILQKKVKITGRDNFTSLAKKVLKQEHKLYPKSILKIFKTSNLLNE